MDAGRSAPTLIRDAHCACGWQRNPQGLGYSSQTMPSSGPGGPASNRTKLVTLWDSVRKSPHKTGTKGKGTCGEHCACPHGWYSPAQLTQNLKSVFITLLLSYPSFPIKHVLNSPSKARNQEVIISSISFLFPGPSELTNC
ncbi:hypothetical protein TREES_T100013005 [Tupaia chinensis]|uniref:Uncharacterized protein n=1 Tax=Tupaia chinensis TaxID=246437 RepID=L9L1M6_TUPCH|nr:hypothetical protein TREES_T100013005 [Tupaia chinensis]